METTLKTAPLAYPISLDEAKQHLRIDLDDTDHDDYVTGLIDVAVNHIEMLTWRKLISQTWYGYFDDWPRGNYFELPFGTLQSATAPIIKYTDVDAVQSTWSSAEYIVGTDYLKGRITLADGYTWPNEVLYPSVPIEVEFVCGYGLTGVSVPPQIKHAIKIAISEFFENREVAFVGVSFQLSDTINNLLSDYRLIEL